MTLTIIRGPLKPFPGFMKRLSGSRTTWALISTTACPRGDAESIQIFVKAYKRAKRLQNEHVFVTSMVISRLENKVILGYCRF